MAVIEQSSAGRRALAGMVARANDVRPYRRAQALRWRAAGERPTAVAPRLRGHRDPVSAWATRSRQRGRPRRPARLMDGARTGRPRRLAERGEQGLVSVRETAPQSPGYRAAPWTTPRLGQDLRDGQALAVRAVTMRRGLHRLGSRWQRPRDVLARRSRDWRQAKGGSRAASSIALGRCCAGATSP
jgi:transposase